MTFFILANFVVYSAPCRLKRLLESGSTSYIIGVPPNFLVALIAKLAAIPKELVI